MNDPQQRLQQLFAALDAQDRSSLLAFAEFLAGRRQTAPAVTEQRPAPVAVPEPENIQRPEVESIVAALKRLSKTYPMLDKGEMLGATSDLVATHVMQGTEPPLVVDQLEAIFAEHYRKLKDGSGS